MTTFATQRILDGMIDKIRREYAPLKIVLFGSYAYGTPHPDSDIDLLLIKETSDRFIDRWTQIQRIITGLHRSIPVEVLVLTPDEIARRLRIGDQFIGEILRKGKVLYAA